ncbi:YdeI/OmpD-associated family protein [Pinibacter soli]|uniref:YdeI/OmpD-associated family protein n=1 Tax=Pinibacter soli TaxID=3044211 RepID=A0ABT6RAT1_9BACT|nr:YdeI/OmpD-associated family protein [Pinibacter soli]MDI3319515.1 YdeI/OmpD-associated family protein [Pinibacter soli]
MKNEGPVFFEKKSDFRKWLQKNHKKETELLVGFYKVGSGKTSITWSDAVDEALCFGWIDAVRKSIDEESYQIRFTQRKPNSIWSAVNITKVEELTRQGLMQPAGLESFSKRTESKSRVYPHENEEIELDAEFKKQFSANEKAWKYFQSLAPSYRKLSISWVMTAKQNGTQLKRLQQLISDCAAGTNRWKDNKYNKK